MFLQLLVYEVGYIIVIVFVLIKFQISTRNSVELLEDDKRGVVNSVAARLGLQCVGWIFTDLVPLDLTKGTVKHFRGTIVSMIPKKQSFYV